MLAGQGEDASNGNTYKAAFAGLHFNSQKRHNARWVQRHNQYQTNAAITNESEAHK